MDKYGVMQVLTLSRPPIEEVISDPKKAMDLTKRANDEMAEIVLTHRDRRYGSIPHTVSLPATTAPKQADRGMQLPILLAGHMKRPWP